jgi:hypothetical protein
MDFPFCAMFWVDNGKIASIRLYDDQLELLTQLGLMPVPAA